MNLLADECCDAPLVVGLRADGHDVIYIKESAPGSTDQSILQLSCAQQRVLLTEDKDFGELVVRLALPAYGIVFLRMDPADSTAKLSRLREVIRNDGHRLAGSFVVVDQDKVRFRPIHPSTP
jgi:predicted nuclease of predicted toxin-antitoxin system